MRLSRRIDANAAHDAIWEHGLPTWDWLSWQERLALSGSFQMPMEPSVRRRRCWMIGMLFKCDLDLIRGIPHTFVPPCSVCQVRNSFVKKSIASIFTGALERSRARSSHRERRGPLPEATCATALNREGGLKREHHGGNRREAYPRSPATSTATTSTAFL
jgi:hypothetical protein